MQKRIKLTACLCSLFACQLTLSSGQIAFAQYQKGQSVEYKEGTYSPWSVGTVEYMTPSGKQVIVRSKPREFYPNGDTKSCDLDMVRPVSGAVQQADPAAAAQNDVAPAACPQAVQQQPAAAQHNVATLPQITKPAAAAAGRTAPASSGPAMTPADVVALFAEKIGNPRQNVWPRNDQVNEEVARVIRSRGVNFDFKINCPQEVTDAINKYEVQSKVTGSLRQNWGPPATKNYFFGGWDMSKIGGVTRVQQYIPGYDLVTQEHGALAGDLKIWPDHQYEWNGIKGNWRDATPDEMALSDKGGAGLVLKDAKMGVKGKDWIVFKHSMTAGDNIEVADVLYRGNREYGGRH
jgi:hypothetical protein